MWCQQIQKEKSCPILNVKTHHQNGKQYVVVSRFIIVFIGVLMYLLLLSVTLMIIT